MQKPRRHGWTNLKKIKDGLKLWVFLKYRSFLFFETIDLMLGSISSRIFYNVIAK